MKLQTENRRVSAECNTRGYLYTEKKETPKLFRTIKISTLLKNLLIYHEDKIH